MEGYKPGYHGITGDHLLVVGNDKALLPGFYTDQNNYLYLFARVK